MRDAIAVHDLEARLGMATGDVLNLAVSGGRPSDARSLYTRFVDRTADARILVVGVEDWQFNAGFPTFPELRFRERASVVDRLTFPVAAELPDLTLGEIWHLWDVRYDLRARMDDVVLRKGIWTEPVIVDGLGRLQVVASGPAPDQGPDTDPPTARQFLSPYAFWRYELDELTRLVDEANARGTRTVLVRLPLRPSYSAAVTTLYAESEQTWLGELRNRGLEVADLKDPGPWEIGPDDWLDYGHLNAAGSQHFTAKFGDWLAARLAA
jgi:hypothetical protein